MDNKYFFHLNEENRKLPRAIHGDNFVSLSELKSAYIPNVVHNYSIKLILAGTEHYSINRKEFVVPEMKFLTACAPCDSVGFFESNSIVKGLCIDVDIKLVHQAYHVLYSEKILDLDNNFLGYFKSKNFFVNVYPALNSELGLKLLSFSEKFKNTNSITDLTFINEETFLELAGTVVIHEFENLKKLNSLSSLKISTKKEILKRLMNGKNYIDDNFRQKIDIKEIARQCYLSEFHFYRSFKEAFGISPYKYLLKRRIYEAQRLLMNENYSVSEVAFKCGFTDIHSFSKTFKKHNGFAPTKFLPKK